MATAAAELFVKVSADIAGLSSGFNAAAQAAKGLGQTIDGTAAAFNMLKSADASLERTKLAAGLLGKAFDETGESIKLTEMAIAKMVAAGLKPGNAALDAATAKLRALQQTATAAAPKISQTAKGFDVIEKNSQGFETARMRAKLLGTAFSDTAERVKYAEKSVSDLINLGLKPGDAAMDRAIVKLRQAQKAHTDTAQAAENHEKKTSLLGKALAGLSLAAVGAGMLGLARHAVNLAAELEQNRVAFTTMLGSAEKADKFLRELATFAANTPFELRGLTDSSKRLLAFGFNAQAIIPIMTGVGNAVAGVGGGKDVLDGVTLALGQMAAKGKVSAEEMNQLAERGIPAWSLLAKAIGKTTPEAMKMAEKGAIDAGTAITALINGMNERFPEMMKKQSETFAGALSNFQDSADQAMTKIGDSIIKMGIGDFLRTMTTGINNLAAAFETGRIIPAIDMAKSAVLGLSAAVTSYFIPGLLAARTTAVATFVAAASAAAPFLALAGAVAFAAYPIIKNWTSIKIGLQDLFASGMVYMTRFYNESVKTINDFVNNWTVGANYIAQVLRSVLGNTIADKIVGSVRKAASAFGGFTQKALPAINAVGNAGRWAASQFQETWGDAMSSARALTVDLFKSTSSATPAVQKITKELLGLSSSTTGAAAAAKKKADALKKAEQEAKKADAAFAKLTKTNQKAYERFELMAMALGKLRAALRVVDADAAKQGRSFDIAGAQAEAYKDNLSAIESAFGKMSVQAVDARAQMAAFAAASANGGAATAQAFAVIDEAAKSLETQSSIALALGRNYDILTETVKSTEEVLGKLIEKGLKPGNKAYDEAAANVTNARKALDSAAFSYDNISNKTLGVLQSLSSITQEALKMADAMGIDLPEEINAFMVSAAAATQRATELAGSIVGVVNGVMSLVELYKVNPILGLIVTGLVALGLAAAFAIDKFNEANIKAEQMAEIARKNDPVMRAFADRMVENNQRIAESYQATMDIVGSLQKTTTDAVTRATFEFMRGIDGWAERLETSLKEAMFKGLMDKIVFETITQQLKGDFDAIANAVMRKNYDLATSLTKDLADKTKGMIQPIAEAGKAVLEGLGLVGTKAEEVLDRALGKASASARATREAVDQGSRGAVESYMRAQMAAMDRFRNMGLGPGTYEYEVARDQAEAAARQLRGMATGGLVTGPTMARLGEGGRNEAVLPLNDSVYRQLGEGIAAARGGSAGAQVVVQYNGNGKWTREDAQGLGRLMVSELRAMGVRA